jgi:hypothetical protein
MRYSSILIPEAPINLGVNLIISFLTDLRRYQCSARVMQKKRRGITRNPLKYLSGIQVLIMIHPVAVINIVTRDR